MRISHLICALAICASAAASARAGLVTYTIDPSLSEFHAEGTIAGHNTDWTLPSAKARLSGTILAERTDMTCTFLDGSTIDVLPQPEPQAPGIGGAEGTAPANFGLPAFDAGYVAAIRDLVFSMEGGGAYFPGSADPPVDPYLETLGLGFTITSGTMDYRTPTASGTFNLGGIGMTNNDDAFTFFTITPEYERISIPVSITFMPDGQSGTNWIHITGSVVAMRPIPEPGVIAPIAVGAVLILRKRRL